MMYISKDNWDIQELNSENYISMQHKFQTINDADCNPEQYFLIKDKSSNVSILIVQSDVGLHNIPYLTFVDKRQSIICLTSSCYVIDYENQKILLQTKLNTPCIEIIGKTNLVYIICESEIIEFLPFQLKWGKTYNLSDSVNKIVKENTNWSVILYDGSVFNLML